MQLSLTSRPKGEGGNLAPIAFPRSEWLMGRHFIFQWRGGRGGLKKLYTTWLVFGPQYSTDPSILIVSTRTASMFTFLRVAWWPCSPRRNQAKKSLYRVSIVVGDSILTAMWLLHQVLDSAKAAAKRALVPWQMPQDKNFNVTLSPTTMVTL